MPYLAKNTLVQREFSFNPVEIPGMQLHDQTLLFLNLKLFFSISLEKIPHLAHYFLRQTCRKVF